MKMETKRLTIEGLAIANRLSDAQTILIERKNQEEVYAAGSSKISQANQCGFIHVCQHGFA